MRVGGTLQLGRGWRSLCTEAVGDGKARQTGSGTAAPTHKQPPPAQAQNTVSSRVSSHHRVYFQRLLTFSLSPLSSLSRSSSFVVLFFLVIILFSQTLPLTHHFWLDSAKTAVCHHNAHTFSGTVAPHMLQYQRSVVMCPASVLSWKGPDAQILQPSEVWVGEN